MEDIRQHKVCVAMKPKRTPQSRILHRRSLEKDVFRVPSLSIISDTCRQRLQRQFHLEKRLAIPLRVLRLLTSQNLMMTLFST